MSGKYPGQQQYHRYGSGNPATGYAPNNPSAASNSSGQYPPSSAVYSNTLQGFPAGTYGPSHHTTPTMSSPYTSSPSPGAAGNGGHFSPYAKGVAPPPLKKYTLQPPAKKPLLHKQMELGYPDIFPQRLNQDEDQLTESNVCNGFMDRPVVSNEHTCAHDMIHGRLVDDPKILADLGGFMVDVLKRKREASRITGLSTFKPPSRSTLNDTKKEQWLQDLAGGVIMLRKLARNVPHGFKGDKLLESLAMKQVPLLRATWYIKIVGLSEMLNSRTKSPNPQQYTLEWTRTVITFLKRQISEIASPSSSVAARAGAQTPGKPAAVDAKALWATGEGNEKWQARWLYSIRLAKWQYNEGLLDQRQFLKFTLDELPNAVNFEQTHLMFLLVNEFLAEYQRNRTLMRLLIDTVVGKVSTLMQHPAYSTDGKWRYGYLERDLKRMIQSIFLSTPDMFVIPRMWSVHHTLLRNILYRDTDADPQRLLHRAELRTVMRRYYRMIRCRNELFCGTLGNSEDDESEDGVAEPAATSIVGEEPEEMDEEEARMRILDCVGAGVGGVAGLEETVARYFSGVSDGGVVVTRDAAAMTAAAAPGLVPDVAMFEAQVRTLCDWAVTVQRLGDWRVYVVSSMLMWWRDGGKSGGAGVSVKEEEKEEDSRRVAAGERQQIVQDALLKFLDGFGAGEMGRKDEEFDAVSRLFGELIRLGLFSYQRYLSRLIARGDLEHTRRTDERTVRHLRYLQGFPLYRSERYQLNQRRVMLYGVDGQDHQENASFEAIVQQIKKKLPHLFSPDAFEMTQPIVDDPVRDFTRTLPPDAELVEALRSASRYCQVRVTHEWLLEAVKKFVVKNVQIGEDNWRVMTSPGSSLLNPRQFLTIVRLMEVAKDYSTLIEMTLWVLDRTNERSLYPLVIDTLRRHHVVWRLMGRQKEVFESVMNKHQALSNRLTIERCLVTFMVQLIQEGLEVLESVRLQVQSDLQIKPISPTMLIHANHPQSIAQELTALLTDGTVPFVASSVAVSLCYKYNSMPNWIGLILDTMVEILRRQSTETTHVPSDVMEGIESASDKAVTIVMPSMGSRFLETRRAIGLFAEVLREIGERTTIEGRLDETMLEWLRAQCNASGAASDNPSEMLRTDDSGMWFPHFLALMVVKGVVRLDLVTRFCLGWLEKAGKGLKAQEMQQPQKPEDEETERMMRICRNVVSVLRLLLVQEEGRTGVSESGEAGGEIGGDDWWLLNLEEIQALRTQRQFLGNLAWLFVPFAILYQLAMIESCVALNHPILQAVQVFRKDLVGVLWFREVCLGNAETVYYKFMRMEGGPEEQQQQPQGNTTTTQEQNHLKEVKRKMVDVFQYVMVEGESAHSLESTGPNSHNSVPQYIARFKSIFAQINKWNLERSRVKFWLLLDCILLMPESPDTDVHGDVVMHDTARSDGGDAIRRDECLVAFVQYFFDELVLGNGAYLEGEGRGKYVRKMLKGVRKEVVNELLRYGEAILSGSSATESTSFADSILLTHSSSKIAHNLTSDRYHQIVRAFYQVMHTLMSEATSDTWTEEKKMEFLKGLLVQIRRLEEGGRENGKEGGKIYDVMHACNVSYADASKALQSTSFNLDAAIVLLRSEGIVHEHGHEHLPERGLMLQDIRASLLVRLRLLVPLLPVIWGNPLRERCDIVEWSLVLVKLVSTTLVHGNGTQERFFEFVLDVVSVLMDEVPMDLRKGNLTQLGNIQPDLNIPVIFSSRIKRILPFQVYNVYMTNLKQAPPPAATTAMTPNPDVPPTMPTPPPPPSAAALAAQQPRPWEWLEDCVPDNSSNENDVPISLAMFGARRIKRADATYVKWFKFGFQEQATSIPGAGAAVEDADANARVKRIRLDTADGIASGKSSRSESRGGSRVGDQVGSVAESRKRLMALDDHKGTRESEDNDGLNGDDVKVKL